jgi:mRNA interferase MazF
MPRAAFVPECGDFVRVVLDPLIGREQSGERPALVLTERRFNELTGYVFVAPITNSVRGWPFEVPIPRSGRVRGVVMADQMKSIDYVARYVRYLARAPESLVAAVLARVAAILDL